MIGSGLRKYAQSQGLTVSNGVAYGLLRGYCTTLSDGANIKSMVIVTRFPDGNVRSNFQAKMDMMRKELGKDYRVQNLIVSEDRITVIFGDTIGTMKRIEAFIPWFLLQLEEAGASKADICSECGMQLVDGRWKLVAGTAIYVHESCGQKLREELQVEVEEQRKEGSYLTGAVGALLGAAVGSVAWALVMLLGYISSLLGLLIGFFAEGGYRILRGKKGPLKIVILLLAVVIGVALGHIACLVVSVFREFKEYGYILSAKEVCEVIVEAMQYDPEVRASVIKDMAMGLFFAALGVIGLISRTKEEVSVPKFIDLN